MEPELGLVGGIKSYGQTGLRVDGFKELSKGLRGDTITFLLDLPTTNLKVN